MNYHLQYLAEAVTRESPLLFEDYLRWLKVFLPRVGVGEGDVVNSLAAVKETLSEMMPAELAVVPTRYLAEGMVKMTTLPGDLPTVLGETAPMALLATQYLNSLLRADRRTASQLILEEVEKGAPVRDLYLGVFQPVQLEIGRLWQLGKITVAQEHFCTAATQMVMSQLYPLIFRQERNGRTFVASCISGELHEIGLRFVADFFEMDGWDTYYLGANVPPTAIISSLKEQKADLLGISATMPFHLSKVEALIRDVRQSEVGRRVKIMVGGYPFVLDPDLWRKVGADGSARDAEKAVRVGEQLLAG